MLNIKHCFIKLASFLVVFLYASSAHAVYVKRFPSDTPVKVAEVQSSGDGNCAEFDANGDLVDSGAGCGSGDVTGPASSTDNAFPRFNGTGGKTLQNGQTVEDDSGNVTVAGTLAVSGATQRLTFTTSGEYIDGTTDDFILLQGVSGADNTDLRFDLDGTRPVIDSPTDTVIEVAEQFHASVTGSSGGILIGDDANLYDNGTSALKTDDAFTALTLTATNNIIQTSTSNLFKTNNGYTPVVQSLVSTSSASDLRNFDITMANSSTGGAYNIDATATRSGAGSSANLFSIRGKGVFTGTSGTQTTAYGIYGFGEINGTGGTITNAYGIYAAPFNVTAGTITNNYALGVGGAVNHLDTDTAGTTTCTTLNGLMTCAVA